MQTPKNWADDHLATYANPQTRAANQRLQAEQAKRHAATRRWELVKGTALWSTLILMVSAAALAAGDYTNLVPLGVLPWHRAPAAPAKPEANILPAELVAAFKAAQERARAAAAAEAADSASQPSQTARDAAEDASTATAATAAIATPAPSAAASNADRRRLEHLAQLEGAITYLRKDDAKAASGQQYALWVLSLRSRPRVPPWTAAETLDEISIYVAQHPQMGSIERRDLQSHHDAAQSDCINARRRLNDLEAERASIKARIDHATAECATLRVP